MLVASARLLVSGVNACYSYGYVSYVASLRFLVVDALSVLQNYSTRFHVLGWGTATGLKGYAIEMGGFD